MANATLQVPQLQRSTRRVPIEQIIQTLGANPVANGITDASAVLAQALKERAAKRQAAAQVAAISKAVGHPMDGLQSPEIASSLGGHFIAADSKPTPRPDVPPIYVTRNDAGGIVEAFTKKPITTPDPSRKYQSLGNDATTDLAAKRLTDKQFTDVDKRLDPNEAGNRKQFGKSADVRMRAQRAIDLIDSKGGILTNAEVNGLATDVAGILAGSQGGMGEAMTKMHGYQTLLGDLNGVRQYTTGNPQQGAPTAIISRLRSNLQGFSDLADRTIKDTQASILYKNDHLRRVDPDRFQRFYDSVGINPGEVVKGQYVPKNGAVAPSSAAPTHRWNPATGKVEVIQ
jgi:hypothetical protein